MLKKFIPKSSYARNVITLMTGTGLAQAIPIAISPILTRLYSPEDFGIFGLYMAIVAIASVLVTGRYELAILLPRNDRDALHIVALAIGLSAAVSALLLVVVLVFNGPITQLLGASDIAPWLYWVPASTVLMGIYTSLNYWSNRKGQYRRLAVSRVVQTSGTSATQLGAAFLRSGPAGLVVGQLTGQLIASSFLARMIYREDQNQIKILRWGRVRALARKYIDLPKYMIAGQLMNTLSGHLPLLLLSVLFGPAVAGLYSLSQRVLVAPSSLIGGAIGDVYRSEASKIYRETGNCFEIFQKTIKKLTAVSILLVLPIFLFGKNIFSVVFGENWSEAGEVASIISIMVFFQSISSPLSQTVLFANKQKLDLVWQSLRLFLAVSSLYIGNYFFSAYKVALLLFAISFAFLYLLHLLFQYAVAKGWR